ncbi:MAG: ATP-binding protein [Aliiglaciecola sp.]
MSQPKWFSPHDPKRRIGSLIDVSATDAKVNLTDSGSGETAWLLGNRVASGEVNEYIFIDAGSHSILGRIVKVWLESGERLSVDTLDDNIPKNNPIGLVQLLVSVDVESGENFKGIKHYPKLGAQLYAAHPKLVSALAEGLAPSDETINLPIAEMPNDSSVKINLSPEKLFSRHCAILGATGGGKSYTTATLIEQCRDAGGKVLLIDATGEYSSLPCTSYYVGKENVLPNAKVTFPHWMFTDTDLRALLRPSVQSQAPKLEAAIQSLKVVTSYYQQQNHGLPISPNHLLIKADQLKAPVEAAIQAISGNYQNIPWNFNQLADQIINECVWPTSGNARAPDPSRWGGKADNDVGHCLNLLSRIKAMSGNNHLRWMIDCDSALPTIPSILENLASSTNSEIVRLDLSEVPFEANSREVLVNAIGRKLLQLARSGIISHQTPLLVFMDESHQFLNKRVGDETSRVDLDAFGNIAKEGRKYGLNVTIATQRPRDIPEDVLSQIGTMIVHRLTNQLDQDIVKKAVGSIDQKSASFLPVLGQGEALLLGVDFPFPMMVKIKRPLYAPESTSASFSNSWNRRD